MLHSLACRGGSGPPTPRRPRGTGISAGGFLLALAGAFGALATLGMTSMLLSDWFGVPFLVAAVVYAIAVVVLTLMTSQSTLERGPLWTLRLLAPLPVAVVIWFVLGATLS